MKTKKMFLVKTESVYKNDIPESKTLGIFCNHNQAQSAMQKEWERELSTEVDWSGICTERELSDDTCEMWEEGRFNENHLVISIEEIDIPVMKQTVFSIVIADVREIYNEIESVPEVYGTYTDQDQAIGNLIDILNERMPRMDREGQKDMDYWKSIIRRNNTAVTDGNVKICIVENEMELPVFQTTNN